MMCLDRKLKDDIGTLRHFNNTQFALIFLHLAVRKLLKLLVPLPLAATPLAIILHAKKESNNSRNDDIQAHLPVHFF
jgi:hypothetical protein